MKIVREVHYSADGLDLVGTLAIPDGSGPFPLVLIAHEGPGLDEIQRGKPLAQVLLDQEITEEQLIEHLEITARDNPQFQWLGPYIKDHRRLEALSRENEVLSRKVTSLTLEIDRLKESSQQSS